MVYKLIVFKSTGYYWPNKKRIEKFYSIQNYGLSKLGGPRKNYKE